MLRWPLSAGVPRHLFHCRLPTVIHPHGLIGPMTRIIQLTGALLGTLIGFALGLALLQRAGGLIEEANRPAFLTAFVVASLLFGYLAIPYITIYPVRRAVEKLSEANAGEFALGVGSIVVGLIMGLLLGVPLAQLGGSAGSLLPPAVALFLAAMMPIITLSKRDELLPALAGCPAAAHRTRRAARRVCRAWRPAS